MVDADHSWQVIEHERLSLADLLEGLTEEQWESPSLCAGWRVRDVAAHVAMAPQVPGIGRMLADAARAGGRFHTFNHDAAVRPPRDRSSRSSPSYGPSRPHAICRW